MHRIRILALKIKIKGKRWRLITASLRQRGTIDVRVDATIKLRAQLARKLREQYGMEAAVGALELGDHENVHLHMLVLSSDLPREELQRWLRSRDCDVPGCRHPADDRCDDCKRRKCACSHVAIAEGEDEGLIRPRCEGSWYLNIENAYTRGPNGERDYSRPAGAAAEVVKYACKPTMRGDPAKLTRDQLASELEYAKQIVSFFVAMKGRHRLETFGLAKKRVAGEDDAIDDADPRPEGPTCPRCRNVMPVIEVGIRQIRKGACGYEWFGDEWRADHAPP